MLKLPPSPGVPLPTEWAHYMRECDHVRSEALRAIIAEMRACQTRLNDCAMSPDMASLEAGAHTRAAAIVGGFAARLAALLPKDT